MNNFRKISPTRGDPSHQERLRYSDAWYAEDHAAHCGKTRGTRMCRPMGVEANELGPDLQPPHCLHREGPLAQVEQPAYVRKAAVPFIGTLFCYPSSTDDRSYGDSVVAAVGCVDSANLRDVLRKRRLLPVKEPLETSEEGDFRLVEG